MWSTRVHRIKRIVLGSYNDIRTDEIVSPLPRHDHLLYYIVVVVVVVVQYCDYNTIHITYMIIVTYYILHYVFLLCIIVPHVNYFHTTTPCLQSTIIIVVIIRLALPTRCTAPPRRRRRTRLIIELLESDVYTNGYSIPSIRWWRRRWRTLKVHAVADTLHRLCTTAITINNYAYGDDDNDDVQIGLAAA